MKWSNWINWFKKGPPEICINCGENPISHSTVWFCDDCLKAKAVMEKKQEEFLDLAIKCLKEYLDEDTSNSRR